MVSRFSLTEQLWNHSELLFSPHPPPFIKLYSRSPKKSVFILKRRKSGEMWSSTRKVPLQKFAEKGLLLLQNIFFFYLPILMMFGLALWGLETLPPSRTHLYNSTRLSHKSCFLTLSPSCVWFFQANHSRTIPPCQKAVWQAHCDGSLAPATYSTTFKNPNINFAASGCHAPTPTQQAGCGLLWRSDPPISTRASLLGAGHEPAVTLQPATGFSCQHLLQWPDMLD